METATATQTAAAPPRTEGSIRRIEKKAPTGSRFIFTVANLIPHQTIAAGNDAWVRGGLIREAQTLKYCSGYIPRCEIREMREYMDSDLASFVNPAKRDGRDPSYGVMEPDPEHPGTMRERIVGEGAGLLFTPIYPSEEVSVLTGARDGLVEMTMIQSAAQLDAAQLVLFPNWPEIAAGHKLLPQRTSQLRAYFMRRLSEATNETAASIIRAAIRSCDDFQSWCEQFIQQMNAARDEAETRGWAWNPGLLLDLACEQSGIARSDRIAQQQNDKLDKLVDSVATLADITAQQTAMRNQEAPLAAAKPDAPTEPAETFADPEPQIAAEAPQCLAMTGKGTRCKNEALEDGFCKIESHTAAAEAARAEAEEAEESTEGAQ